MRPAAEVLVRRRVEELRPHLRVGELPTLSEAEFGELKADIERRGLQTPLHMTEAGVVLDGHARLRATAELGIEEVAVLVVDDEGEEFEFMLRAALLRRQLSAGQKAALALLLCPFEQLREQANGRQRANLRRGAEAATLPARDEGRTRDLIAKLAGSSPRTAQDVITAREHDPELFERVLHGRLSANTAASKVRRRLRDSQIPAAPPMPEGPFELIYADPPWRYGSPDSSFSPEQHYPTMTLPEIAALELPSAENCVLFLWIVNELLPAGFELLRGWGFEYQSNAVWDKQSIGPGVWLRQQHELLLIATRGKIAPPDPDQRCSSVISAPRGRHSEKPLQAYELIERMYPHLTKLELFARGTARPGWTCWGNEAEPVDSR